MKWSITFDGEESRLLLTPETDAEKASLKVAFAAGVRITAKDREGDAIEVISTIRPAYREG